MRNSRISVLKTSQQAKQTAFCNAKSRAGAAAVETAVVLPIFLLVIFGIVEFGRAMSVTQMLTAATRDHCRRATLDGETNASIIDSTRSFLVSTVRPSSEDFTITISVNRQSANNQIEKAKPGDIVTVNAEIPFQSVKYIPGRFLSGLKLSSTCSMLHE